MNKFMNEYLKNLNNEEENLKFINAKLNKQKVRKRKILNIAAIIFVVFFIGTLTPHIYAKFQQNMKYKEYTRRDYVSGKGEIASAYNENIDMEYVFQNDIGVKVDSIVLTDDTFKANINIKLPVEMRKSKLLENNTEYKNIIYHFGFAIYDENNNIFACGTRLDENYELGGFQEYLMCLYKELGIKFNKYNFQNKMLSRQWGYSDLGGSDDEIIKQIELNSWTGFPKSKKMYIRIFNIGYEKYGKSFEDNVISKHNDLEWIFEIETPDKFLKRETIDLALVDEIPRLNIEKFTLTETGLLFVGKKKGVIETIKAGMELREYDFEEIRGAMLNITDDNGNIYYPWSGGTTGERNGFYGKFEIDKDLFESTTFYLNMKIGDEEYTSEISKKE